MQCNFFRLHNSIFREKPTTKNKKKKDFAAFLSFNIILEKNNKKKNSIGYGVVNRLGVS
jgi:hypothetical protein